MRCLVVDPNPVFLHWMKRYFQYTPAGSEGYVVVVGGDPQTTFQALPAQYNACVVVPGREEAQLRLVCHRANTTQTGSRYTLHCPSATSNNTRQLMKAVVKRMEGVEVDVLVVPMMGNRAVTTARDMHAGYLDAVLKKI